MKHEPTQRVLYAGPVAIGTGRPTFLVAEMACAHEGSAARALELIEALDESGVDAIQLQIFRAGSLIAKTHRNHDLVRGLELVPGDWKKILARARSATPQIWVNVFDPASLDLAVEGGADLLKLHSTDLSHPPFLEAVARCGLPLSLSTGGSTTEELDAAVEVLRRHALGRFVLMHGYQAYPTPVEEARLARIAWLRERYDCPVGFQDHAAGDSRMAWLLPAAAIGAGADVIEKHVTDDRSREGIDHEAALEPRELTDWVNEMRAVDRSIGSAGPTLSAPELAYRRNFKRSIVASRPIAAGERLERTMVEFLRAGSGLAPTELERIRGGRVLRPLALHQPIEWTDVVPADRPRVVACIAARMHSKRLPRKALLPVDGVPMLRRLIDRLRTAESVDEVVVCTSKHPDDRVLLERAEEWGAAAVAGSEEDVLSRFLTAGERTGAELIVRVTGDNVLTDPRSIDRLVELQRTEDADYTRVSGAPLGVTPEVMTLSFLRRLHAEMADPNASEYLIFFAFDPERYRCRVLPADEAARRPHYALTVDTPADLELMDRLHRELDAGSAGPTVEEVCDYLDRDPGYSGVPDDAPIKLPDGVVWSFTDYLRWHEQRSEAAAGSERLAAVT